VSYFNRTPKPKATKKYIATLKDGKQLIILGHEIWWDDETAPNADVWLNFCDATDQTVALVRSTEVLHVISEAL
jgi:hypothetical protein